MMDARNIDYDQRFEIYWLIWSTVCNGEVGSMAYCNILSNIRPNCQKYIYSRFAILKLHIFQYFL